MALWTVARHLTFSDFLSAVEGTAAEVSVAACVVALLAILFKEIAS